MFIADLFKPTPARQPTPAPTRVERTSEEVEASGEELRRRGLRGRGPSLRAATLLGQASDPASGAGSFVARTLGGGVSI